MRCGPWWSTSHRYICAVRSTIGLQDYFLLSDSISNCLTLIRFHIVVLMKSWVNFLKQGLLPIQFQIISLTHLYTHLNLIISYSETDFKICDAIILIVILTLRKTQRFYDGIQQFLERQRWQRLGHHTC